MKILIALVLFTVGFIVGVWDNMTHLYNGDLWAIFPLATLLIAGGFTAWVARKLFKHREKLEDIHNILQNVLYLLVTARAQYSERYNELQKILKMPPDEFKDQF